MSLEVHKKRSVLFSDNYEFLLRSIVGDEVVRKRNAS